MSWVDTMRTLDHPPFIVWLLVLKEVFFVLLIFKVFTNDWLGRKGFKKRRKKKK